jgi:hypothetical protein
MPLLAWSRFPAHRATCSWATYSEMLDIAVQLSTRFAI